MRLLTRHVLRALYSSSQVQEQNDLVLDRITSAITFTQSNIRPACWANYEEAAVRPRALGKFSELLRAVVYHPVMLRYLD